MSERAREKKTVSYLGPRGTFCEQAASKFFSSANSSLISASSVSEVFKAVESGRTRYGVVPVENSLEGSVHVTLDLLLKSNLMVCGEVELRIEQCLIAKSGLEMEDIRLVLSHAQALAQSREFLEEKLPHAEIREVSSTAMAVEMITSLENAAAIGPAAAAENGRMTILVRGIEDNSSNFTRFFILNREDATPTRRDKTSIIFTAKNIPGSLYRILEAFAIRKINLTKIESRPTRGKPWEYMFYLDFEGHRTNESSQAALRDMEEKCIFVKVLGSYPRAM